MEMYPVVSTSVAKAGYDVDGKIFRVEYANGDTWDYALVSLAWFEAFTQAESKGRFVIGVKKDPIAHPCRRVTHKFNRRREYFDACVDCGCPKAQADIAKPCQAWPAKQERPF